MRSFDRVRYVPPPPAYDPSENVPRDEPKRRRKGNFCPTMYHMHDNLSGNEFASMQRQARDLEVSSESLLNLIVSLHRKGQRNDLISLLDYLEQLR